MLLVRHAQSEWNATGRWQGWADPPLSDIGRDQARQAGERLRRIAPPFTWAVSSDLDRARTTAGILAGLAGTDDLLAREPRVETVPGLRELNVGDWSGLTRAEIDAKWPERLARWNSGDLDATPGGETREAFDRRVRAALSDVLAARSDERLLVVAHGGVLRSVGRWLGATATGLHIAGFWLEPDGEREPRIAGAVDLLEDAPEGEAVPDDSAGAL